MSFRVRGLNSFCSPRGTNFQCTDVSVDDIAFGLLRFIARSEVHKGNGTYSSLYVVQIALLVKKLTPSPER